MPNIWKVLVIKQELKTVYCFTGQVLYFNVLNASRVISAWGFGLFTYLNYLLNTWKRNTETKFWVGLPTIDGKLKIMRKSE